MTYREAKDDFDRTLDSIRKDHQILEGALFDSIVKEAQSTELGEEWYSMPTRHASFMHIDKETLELMTSPYVSRSRPIEWREM
ncbi:hypothetical protein KAI87_05265, partial [Myxococcota bacterium]|nr:hypothetical protein [Myxococcota bacterium]